MKLFIVLLITLFITSCAEYGAVSSGVVDYGDQIETEALKVARFKICKAGRVGVIMREYWSDPVMRKGWIDFCLMDENKIPDPNNSSQ